MKDFDLGDVLSITTNRLVSPRRLPRLRKLRPRYFSLRKLLGRLA